MNKSFSIPKCYVIAEINGTTSKECLKFNKFYCRFSNKLKYIEKLRINRDPFLICPLVKTELESDFKTIYVQSLKCCVTDYHTVI